MEQAGLIYEVDSQYIARPNTSEGLRLFRNKLDGKYYVKRKDGTLELFITGSETFVEDFVPLSNNQIFFIIPLTPSLLFKPILMVNGQEQRYGFDYDIVGDLLRWLSQDYSLTITDKLNLYYSV